MTDLSTPLLAAFTLYYLYQGTSKKSWAVVFYLAGFLTVLWIMNYVSEGTIYEIIGETTNFYGDIKNPENIQTEKSQTDEEKNGSQQINRKQEESEGGFDFSDILEFFVECVLGVIFDI
jgi:hypothetical protein